MIQVQYFQEEWVQTKEVVISEFKNVMNWLDSFKLKLNIDKPLYAA